MVARILPIAALIPVLLAGWLTSQGAARLHAVGEEEVVSYSQLLKQAEAEAAELLEEGGETVLVATNE